VALAATSYLTTFLRERFLLQHALGSSALDGAVLAYAAAAGIGNLCGISLGLIWIDGRRIPRWATPFVAYVALGAAVAIVAPVSGSIILLGSLVFAFEYGRQRAAYRSRQHVVLFAAVVAPGATIAWWYFVGVSSLPLIIGGYALGYVIQGGASWAAARGSTAPSLPRALPVTVAWPVAFAGLTLMNGYLDRAIFSSAGRGWPAASAFSLNLAQAVMATVAGPL